MLQKAYRSWWKRVTSGFRKAPIQPPYSHVCQVGDPVLRTVSAEVPLEECGSQHIFELVARMQQVMMSYGGVGLAAPQIGVPLRIITYHVSASHIKMLRRVDAEKLIGQDIKPVPFNVIINPKLRVSDNSITLFPEVCLSFLGFSAAVPRYSAVTVTGLSTEGTPVTVAAKGFLARLLQHEVDHLDGRLYCDIMRSDTLRCEAWHRINETGGNIKMEYRPR